MRAERVARVLTCITITLVPGEDSTMVCVRFEGSDLDVLEALIDAERLSRSDIVRRAVRAYAEKLGVTPKRKKR